MPFRDYHRDYTQYVSWWRPCIYSWEGNVLTEDMITYADVARHDIYDGHKLTDPFIRELVMAFAHTEDMDDG